MIYLQYIIYDILQTKEKNYYPLHQFWFTVYVWGGVVGGGCGGASCLVPYPFGNYENKCLLFGIIEVGVRVSALSRN